jgi:hypothetical protein
MTDTCGIPNKANVHYGLTLGRDIPGGTETCHVDVYVCTAHDPRMDEIRTVLAIDDADSWTILDVHRADLR